MSSLPIFLSIFILIAFHAAGQDDQKQQRNEITSAERKVSAVDTTESKKERTVIETAERVYIINGEVHSEEEHRERAKIKSEQRMINRQSQDND